MAMIGQRLFSGRVAVAWAAITFTRKMLGIVEVRSWTAGKWWKMMET